MFAQFLLYLKKITYLDVDHGRSWHLHALHNITSQGSGQCTQFVQYRRDQSEA